MGATKKLRYSIDEDQHTASWETAPAPDYDDATQTSFEEEADPDYDQPADPDYDDAVQADYDDYGQPDYDQLTDSDYGDELAAPVAAEAPTAPPAPSLVAAGFTYALGRVVCPATQLQGHPVIWQGYLRERHPVTGLLLRVPVYQLGDGFWDCYREDELQAA